MTALYTRTPVRCAAMRGPKFYIAKRNVTLNLFQGSLEVLYKILYQEMLKAKLPEH